jgi:hypothetical protein
VRSFAGTRSTGISGGGGDEVSNGATRHVDELVRAATVVIASGPDATRAAPQGSGFLVAPGRVLTCAHVVSGLVGLWVRWQGRTFRATCDVAEPATWDGDVFPAPDAAVLTVEGLDLHPVLPLDAAAPVLHDELYVYGITRVRTGDPEPDGGTFTYGGPVATDDRLFKLVGGQLARGQSGGPVLNVRTGRICGMAKSTRDADADAGGWAVPIADAVAVVDGLRAANDACFPDSLDALRTVQAGLGPLPRRVADLLARSGATGEVVRLLAELGIGRPAHTVETAEVDEWAARQLFELTLKEFIDVLVPVSGALGGNAVTVLDVVACCLPLGGDPPVWWMPSEAAAAVRAEWARTTPRIIRVSSDNQRSRRLLLTRAAYTDVPVINDDLPFGAAVTATGEQADVVASVRAWVEYTFVADPGFEWADIRGWVLGNLPRGVLQLDAGILADAALLRSVAAFDGLRFVVCSAADPVAGADDVLLDLKPAIDRRHERLAMFQLAFADPTAAAGGAR